MEQMNTISSEGPTMEVESERDPEEENALRIPDGGWGWVVCLAGFMMNFTTVGMISTNGILLLALIDLYGATVSQTAVVGSIFMGMINCVGPFVLLLMMFNASHRQIIICGGFFSAISTFTSFFVQKLELLYITYGIFSGCFVGISYFSCNVMVGYYFKKKRTLAVGIAHSGAGFGIFSLSYLTERSISFYGMRGTFLLISSLFLNFIVYGAVCRPLKTLNEKNKKMKAKTEFVISERKSKSVPVLETETNLGFEPDENIVEIEEETNTNSSNSSVEPGPFENDLPRNVTSTCSSKCKYLRKILFDPDVMKNPGMQLLISVYLLWAAAGISIIYLPAKCVNVGLNREQGALIVSIYGAVITISQIVIGLLVDFLHIPKSYLLMSSLLVMSVATLSITFCQTFSFFVLCTSLLAICHGFSFTLRIVLVTSILGVENLDKGYSPLCLMTGLTYIIDTIIAGYLFDATQSYDAVFYLHAGSLFLASVISSGIIYIQRKGKFRE